MRTIARVIIMELDDYNENDEGVFKSKIELNQLKIDLISHKVMVNEKEITLTNLEFNLLLFLANHPNRVYTYEQIYEAVWGEPYTFEKGNIMTHISHLKSKIEPGVIQPKFIENIRGVGYRFIKK